MFLPVDFIRSTPLIREFQGLSWHWVLLLGTFAYCILCLVIVLITAIRFLFSVCWGGLKLVGRALRGCLRVTRRSLSRGLTLTRPLLYWVWGDVRNRYRGQLHLYHMWTISRRLQGDARNNGVCWPIQKTPQLDPQCHNYHLRTEIKPVPNHVKHMHVIPHLNPILEAHQAVEPCSHYTPQALLAYLNSLTGYNLPLGHGEPHLESGLNILISQDHDFGTAYAWFRTAFLMVEDRVCRPRFYIRSTWPWHDDYEPRNLPLDAMLPLITVKIFPCRFSWPWITVRIVERETVLRSIVPFYVGLPNLALYDKPLTTAIAPEAGGTRIQQLEGGSEIIHPRESRPRRLWDLIANRVIPYDWRIRSDHELSTLFTNSSMANLPRLPMRERFVAISHSWAPTLRRDPNLSPVNRGQWPIPLPDGVKLEDIRQELLSFHGTPCEQINLTETATAQSPLDMEYCWLDILCLRQAWCDKNGEVLVQASCSRPANFPRNQDAYALDRTRVNEWKLDVPTIGAVYRKAYRVVVYLNGLAHEVDLDWSNWKSNYHWTNRVWTLQEWVLDSVNQPPLFMGLRVMPGSSQYWDKHKTLAHKITSTMRMVTPRAGMIGDANEFCDLLSVLCSRSCSNPVDRIAGILYFLPHSVLQTFPVYEPDESCEQAWSHLTSRFSDHWRLQLSIALPQSGRLLPTWDALVKAFSPAKVDIATQDIEPNNIRRTQSVTTLLPERPLLGALGITIRFLMPQQQARWPPTSSDPTGILLCPRLWSGLHRLPTPYAVCPGCHGSKSLFTECALQFDDEKHQYNPQGEFYLVPAFRRSLRRTFRPPNLDQDTCCYENLLHDLNSIFQETQFGCEIQGLVCIPSRNLDQWDGISLRKVGCVRVRVPKMGWRNALVRDLVSECSSYDHACGDYSIPVVNDIRKLSVSEMRDKYGTREGYSVIYATSDPSVM